MTLSKVFVSFAASSIMLSVFAAPVFAQTPSEQMNNQIEDVQNNREQFQQDLEENKQQREELREQNVEARCSIATTRIDTTIERYQNGTLRYVNQYNNLVERLNNVITRLNEEDIDTTELSGYVNDISALTNQFNNEMSITIASLEETKSLACGESEGAYLDVLQQSRSELLQARSTAVEINNIFLTDVVRELKDIKNSL